MKKMYIIPTLIFLFIFSENKAQTCGTQTASTEANEAVVGSTSSWTTLGNSATSNDIRDLTGNLSSSGQYTNRLKLTNFNFSIPANSSIVGITVNVERSVGANINFTDREIMIVKGGITQTGTNKATPTIWTNTDATVSYGSSADLWANTWLPSDINSSGFGVAIAAQRTQASGAPTNARVDFVSITVCYLTLTPLTIKQFTVTKTANGAASINWITTNEQQVKYIQLQKSTNGVDFSLFKSVLSTGKYLSTDNQYQITDHLLLNGITYYRLKIIDENGSFQYSEIKTATISNNLSKAYINYANQQINIGISNGTGNYTLQVNDITGRLLFSKTITSNGNLTLINVPFKLNTNQLIVISLKGNHLSLQQKYLSGY